MQNFEEEDICTSDVPKHFEAFTASQIVIGWYRAHRQRDTPEELLILTKIRNPAAREDRTNKDDSNTCT